MKKISFTPSRVTIHSCNNGTKDARFSEIGRRAKAEEPSENTKSQKAEVLHMKQTTTHKIKKRIQMP